jgi:sigma-54 dependent transcriptional regulator, acetoin dehydrogenase operon transcriptional activator AcoR
LRALAEQRRGRYGWDHVANVGMMPPLRIVEVPKGRLVTEAHPRDDRRGAASREPPGASPHLASARERFLTAEPVNPGVVRRSILASWTRSRDWKVPADRFELPYDPNPNRDTRLTYSASNVISDLADQLAGEPVCIVLTDAQGVVLDRRTGDPALRAHLDGVKLDIGFSYSEQHVGTNGIGTALEGRGPAEVFGHEHYVEHLEDLACAGAPIHDPITGKLVGVIDLTCWRVDANPLMVAAATTAAKRIEEALFEHAGRHEVALLHDYLLTCRRGHGAVLAVSNDMVMMNNRAREILDPADQQAVLAQATEALSTGGRQLLILDLPSGATARVLCKPSWDDRSVTGGVVQVQLTHPVAVDQGHDLRQPAVNLPAAAGSGMLWTKCCRDVDRYFQSREWLVLEGEPGVGKLTIARGTHQRHLPAGRMRVFDGIELAEANDSMQWVDEIAEEIDSGTETIILAHIDQLPDEALRALYDVLEPHRESTGIARPWVVATRGHQLLDYDGNLARLLRCFPRSLQIPPLRHHIEDLHELVPFMISRLTKGGSLSCSPDAMRLLMRNRWAGNIAQLYQTVRKIVAKRRTGVIMVADLPPECRASTRRLLTPLESLERDAIVQALLNADGNKLRAAQQLGMSRATIYRKIREYGITMPLVPERPGGT